MWDDINDLTFRWILYGHKTELRAINSQVTEFNSIISIRDTMFLHFSW